MSLKERINLVKQQFGISEADTLNIEKALGKKLVDYESIEALVAALMEYYNGELKKKANTSHTHDYAPSSHKHKKADISDFPTSMKNPNALEIKMNGQNPVSYDGAAAESINITASGIGAEPSFSKNGAFNKNFGTTSNTVLEGAKLAEILGLTYGGNLNTSSAKTVNYAYYDSTTKKVYKCIKATSINYADANYFEAISNNDLLGKLQNLNKKIEVLYSTTTRAPLRTNINLNKSLINFDAIVITYGNYNGKQVDSASQFILVEDIVFSTSTNDNGVGDRHLNPKQGSIDYTFISDKQSFFIYGLDETHGSGIFKIIGIKF